MADQTSSLSNRRLAVVDDEPLMLETLRVFLKSKQAIVRTYPSARAFLDSLEFLHEIDAVIADIRMAPTDGLQLLEACKLRGFVKPFIFLTGYADVRLAVAAMKAGAADLIQKPFDPETFESSILAALERSNARPKAVLESNCKERLDRLSPRQDQILKLIVDGMTSKEIARELGMSFRTVESHRVAIMVKLEAKTLADLIKLKLAHDLAS